MTSIPHNHHREADDADGNVGDPGPTPVEFIKKIHAWWFVIAAVFGLGGMYVTFTGHTARLDVLEKRQESSDEKIDARLRAVESGVTTLLERTKPRP